MLYRISILILFLSIFACKNDKKSIDNNGEEENKEITFNKNKWQEKVNDLYPYRDLMLKDVVYNDTIRTLNKEELLELLGEPDRINEGHLYYLITQTRLGAWPIQTKTMVIKLTDKEGIEWIKIHG